MWSGWVESVPWHDLYIEIEGGIANGQENNVGWYLLPNSERAF